MSFGNAGIIELDGHEYHSSKEQLEKDAIRQRYLTRAGYSVIRFTGREIFKNVTKCVNEVYTIYKERMQRQQAIYRVMYIDYNFLQVEIRYALKVLKEIHPQKSFSIPEVKKIIQSGIEWLHEKSFVTVYVFHDEANSNELKLLDGSVCEYEKGEVRINAIYNPLYATELCEHFSSYTHLFDDFFIVADDPAYIVDLLELFALKNGKLLRRGNYETCYHGTELLKVRWQDIYYIICDAIGLKLNEM